MDAETKSLTDCIYFITSRCNKGDACEFRHSMEAKRNPNPCNFWIRGTCTNPFCKFRHPAGLGRAAAGAGGGHAKHAGAPHPSADPTTTSCWFYLNGGCNKGAACSFIHDPANLPRGFDPKDGTKLNGDVVKKSAIDMALEPEDTGSSKGKSSIFSRVGANNSSKPAAAAGKKSSSGISKRELLKAQADDSPAPDFGVKPLTNLVDESAPATVASSDAAAAAAALPTAEKKKERPAAKPTASKNIDGALNQMFSRALAGTGVSKKRQRSEEEEESDAAAAAGETAATTSDAKRQKIEEAPKAAAPKAAAPAPAPAPVKPAPVAVDDLDDDELAGLDDDLEGEVPDDIQLE